MIETLKNGYTACFEGVDNCLFKAEYIYTQQHFKAIKQISSLVWLTNKEDTIEKIKFADEFITAIGVVKLKNPPKKPCKND